MSPLAKSIWRSIVALISFTLPVLAISAPTWENITLGSLIFGVLHYAEKKSGI